jgi:hypothetical protein
MLPAFVNTHSRDDRIIAEFRRRTTKLGGTKGTKRVHPFVLVPRVENIIGVGVFQRQSNEETSRFIRHLWKISQPYNSFTLVAEAGKFPTPAVFLDRVRVWREEGNLWVSD